VYTNFFGFKERPFQLVPNPEYLFLSRSHEEALAHLNYALSHGEGFVEITGEVGTGKTTLCRAFLEDLDENTEVAYIFNPRLSSIELLQTINQEFGIGSKGKNAKSLMDTLNTFLMEKKREGKNAVLLIDEAQNLSLDVLEQLRLLSNLETNTSKLIQIILVGQPELSNLLDSHNMRQLRQRITLSWYLTPLSRKETKEYVRHRISIASRKTEELFTESAFYSIYKFSRGIPRLINIACDRALLTAFSLSKKRINSSIARSSIAELKSRGGNLGFSLFAKKLIVGTLALLSLGLVSLFLYKQVYLPTTKNEGSKKVVSTSSQKVSKGRSDTLRGTNIKFYDYLNALSNQPSRFTAVKTVLSQWESSPVLNNSLNSMQNDPEFFYLAAGQNRFQVLTIRKDLELVKKLNLPAILEFLPPGNPSTLYLILFRITPHKIFLSGGEEDQIIAVEEKELTDYWSGTAYIFWKNFFNYRGVIPTNAPKESIFTLKMLLRDIGYKGINLDYLYDDSTREAIVKIQKRHGIGIDGIVGAKTKIVIYNERKDLNIPYLRVPWIVKEQQKGKEGLN
jgi:general secretion pathway protein A